MFHPITQEEFSALTGYVTPRRAQRLSEIVTTAFPDYKLLGLKSNRLYMTDGNRVLKVTVKGNGIHLVHVQRLSLDSFRKE